jgi:hypothetical protein
MSLQADKFGTLSEQARFRANWMSPGERLTSPKYLPNVRCKTCRHRGPAKDHCKKLSCATAQNAVCVHWERSH